MVLDLSEQKSTERRTGEQGPLRERLGAVFLPSIVTPDPHRLDDSGSSKYLRFK
jgi:hypothetical protein